MFLKRTITRKVLLVPATCPSPIPVPARTLVRDDHVVRIVIEVQRVEHESRLHLDIESDDVEAEVARLEALGATRVSRCRSWWVMQAPTGQRFCVVRAQRDLTSAPGVRTWAE